MSKNDCNFDTRTKTFKNNIYGTGKGKIREAVLLQDLTQYLTQQCENKAEKNQHLKS
ncbi:hypothetical protein RT723_17335 [Psychrosphaera aquimarina]|uniref:Uncharacterized protein n=1 Tax=Psychrosphaera aquimarina TaxID=2044854 RepID=A0ABU3R4W2_9GAMM|nr:hypothetical protein [Psychrosphaera aquimarina]MDU0114722.1 hypothetical protein [Psychrosphaera aquimarina]